MAEGGWGHLADKADYGLPFDIKSDFDEISFQEALDSYPKYMHAAHGMLYMKDNDILWNLFPKRGAVMMQMRFDGTIGFPGGLMDEPGETVVQTLNREMEEEFALDLKKYSFVQDEHIITHVNKKKELVTHFYAKEVSKDIFEEIERAALSAEHYGTETLGVIRAPLSILGDGYRGLPVFLANRFAGNAKEQFLLSLRKLKVIPEDVLMTAIAANIKYEQALKQPSCEFNKLEDIHMDNHSTNFPSDYIHLDVEELECFSYYNKAAHALIYARKDDGQLVIWMHMRFDGYLGFPGGSCDDEEELVEAVNREVEEEFGFVPDILDDQLMLTHVNHKSKLLLGLYVVEIPYSELKSLEEGILDAEEYGLEVMGGFRVPTAPEHLSAFLENVFIGNTKDQLVHVLEQLKVIPKNSNNNRRWQRRACPV